MRVVKKYENQDIGICKLKADVVEYEDGTMEVKEIKIMVSPELCIRIPKDVSDAVWRHIWSKLDYLWCKEV